MLRGSLRSRSTRLVTVVAGLAAATVLVWRAGWSLDGVPWWFGGPALAVEAFGFALGGLLLFQLWPSAARPVRGPAGAAREPVGPGDEQTTIVVVATGASIEDLHTSLLGAREARGLHRTVAVLGREDVAAFALVARLGADYTTVDERGLGDALERVRAEVDTPYLLVVRAGDVVMPDALERLGAELDGATAMVQGRIERANPDALIGWRDPRRAARFDNVTGAALGARGLAPWLGSGALFSSAALDAVGGFATGRGSSELRTVVRFHRAGYGTRFCDALVVETTAPSTFELQLADRRVRATAALGVLRTAESPLRARRLPWRARLAASAGIGRYLPGVYSLGFVALLGTALVLGAAPVHTTWGAAIAWWLPAHALMAAAVLVAALGSLRLGDRSRTGLRSLGVDAAAVGAAFRRTRGSPAPLSATPVPRRWPSLWPLVLAMVALDAAIVARFASGVLDRGLPRFTSGLDRVLVLGAAALTVARMIAVLHGAARRRRARASQRVPLGVDVRFEAHLPAARVLDISTTGVGVLFPADALSDVPEIGDPIGFSLTLPTLDDRTDQLTVFGEVATTTALPDGSWRVGLTYGDLVDRDAIITFCRITHPARAARIDAGAGGDLVLLPAELGRARDRTTASPRRPVLRIVNAAAVVALVGTMTPTAAFAADPGTATIRGHLSDASHAPHGHTKVLVYDDAGHFVAEDEADAGGEYSVSGLTPGSIYHVYFDPLDAGWIATWLYDGATLVDVVLGSGEDRTIDQTVHREPSATGRLVDDGGSPVAGVRVWVDADGTAAETTSAADGTFTLSWTPWFTNTLRADGRDDYVDRSLALGSYEEALDHDYELGDVALTSLPPDGTAAVHGRVTKADSGEPVAGLTVTAFDWEVPGFVAATATTDADGEYEVAGLTPGHAFYLQYTGGPSGHLAANWWLSAPANRSFTDHDVALEPGGASLHGIVATSEGTPAAGAHVEVQAGNGSFFLTADGAGHYSLSGVATDAGVLACVFDAPDGWSQECYDDEHVGYGDHMGRFTLSTGEDRTVDFTLERYGRLVGRIVDGSGNPVPGATVGVDRRWWWSERAPRSTSTTTAADGTFTLDDVPPGNSVAFTVDANGYVNAEFTSAFVPADGTVNVGDRVVHALGAISGRLIDVEGNPVEGLFLTTDHGSGALAAADGTFTIPYLDPSQNPYAVLVPDDAQYAAATVADVTVLEGPSITQVGDVTVHRKATLTGRVVDGAGAPVPGVWANADGTHVALTGGDGRFSIAGVTPGSLTVTFSGTESTAPTTAAATVAEGPGATDVGDVVVHAWSHITGAVTGDGAPVGGISVSTADDAYSTTTAEDGTYDLKVPDGSHTVRVGTASDAYDPDTEWETRYHDADPASATIDPVIVGPAATVAGVSVVLHRKATLSGTVTDARTGAPIESACVTVYWRRGGGDYTVIDWVRGYPLLTDAQGHYTAPGIGSGTAYVLARVSTLDPGSCGGDAMLFTSYQSAWYGGRPAPNLANTRDPVADGATAVAVDTAATSTIAGLDVAVTQRAGATITGRVVDEHGAPVAGAVAYAASLANWALMQFDAAAITDGNGEFTLVGLPEGEIAVAIISFNEQGEHYEWWNDRPLTIDEHASPMVSPGRDGADLITVTAHGDGGYVFETRGVAASSLHLEIGTAFGDPAPVVVAPTTAPTSTTGPGATTTTAPQPTTTAPTPTTAPQPTTTGPVAGRGAEPEPESAAAARTATARRAVPTSLEAALGRLPADHPLRRLRPSANLTGVPAASRPGGGPAGGAAPLGWIGLGVALAAAGAAGAAGSVIRVRRLRGTRPRP